MHGRILPFVFIILLTSCNSKRYKAPRIDPLYIVNMPILYINTVLDRGVLEPVAIFYHHRVPPKVQHILRNFVYHIGEAGTAFNQLLQNKKQDMLTTITRFFYNTFWGVFGLFDPARKRGLVRMNTSFNDTLGHWGIPPGPFIILPGIGPSYARHAGGSVIDLLFNPGHLLSPLIVPTKTILTRAENIPIFRQIYTTAPNLQALYDDVRNITLQAAEGSKSTDTILDDSLNDDIF